MHTYIHLQSMQNLNIFACSTSIRSQFSDLPRGRAFTYSTFPTYIICCESCGFVVHSTTVIWKTRSFYPRCAFMEIRHATPRERKPSRIETCHSVYISILLKTLNPQICDIISIQCNEMEK